MTLSVDAGRLELELPFRWDAQWIWHGDVALARGNPMQSARRDDVRDRWVLLRREIDLDEPVDGALLRAAGDSRFVVWVNGVEVSRGPVRSEPTRMRSELVDVSEQLVAGANAVAVLARYYGDAVSWWLPSPVTIGLGGGGFALELRLSDGTIVGTDASWRALDGEAWRPAPPPDALAAFLRESVDARLLPAGWTAAGFDDSGWEPATVLPATNLGTRGESRPPTDPYGPLLPRPVPQLTAELRRPVAVSVAAAPAQGAEDEPLPQVARDLGDGTTPAPVGIPPSGRISLAAADDAQLVCVDFGETVSGTLVLDLDAPAGTRIDWALGEAVDDAGRLVGHMTHHGLRYVARGMDDRHESFDPMGGRFGVAAVRSSGPVSLSIAICERLFPRDASAVSFTCSDPALEEIFNVGLRTVDVCAHDAFIDCPTREARAWTGDFVVPQAVHLACCDDWSLARWHAELAMSPRPDGLLPMASATNMASGPNCSQYIPDWPLHWIRGVHNLMRYTGDRELVAGLMTGAESVLRWFLPFVGEDGLLHDVPGWVLIDWSAVPVADTSAALNALWARGLRDFEEMAQWLGDGGRAAWAAGLRERLSEAFEVFWDRERGAYHDNRVGGVVGSTVSRHTVAAAICAGIVPPERLDGLAELLADRSVLAHSVPTMEAMAVGDFERGLSYLLEGDPEPGWDVEHQVLEAQPFFRYVVHDALAQAGRADLIADACLDWQALLVDGARTWAETWAGGTRCHGWSSTPTRDLIVYTLGITPAEPGFGVARVAPRLGKLDWAQATVPIPAGPLSVRATRDSVSIDSPVPVELDLGDGVRFLDAGAHEIACDPRGPQ